MGLFGLSKKKETELPEETLKWNKMWALWAEGKIESPCSELMNYYSEINNGGHSQYFCNTEISSNIQKEMSSLERILPAQLKTNLQKAYKAYLILDEIENKDDEKADKAEEILVKCDDIYDKHEKEINSILEAYAANIKL